MSYVAACLTLLNCLCGCPSRPRVGRAELRGLLGDLTLLEAVEEPSLGSRAALSPVRAPARLREAHGGLQARPTERS